VTGFLVKDSRKLDQPAAQKAILQTAPIPVLSSDISQSDATLGYNQRYKNWG
jgi:hypothetical protein